MVVVPTARASTKPDWSTDATDVVLLLQVTVRPVSTLPEESLRVALSWTL